MENKRKLITYVLDAATENLCNNLNPAKILQRLKTRGELSGDDIQEITSSARFDDRVDRMLEMLKRRRPSAYDEFMRALAEFRQDLFDEVKEIENACPFSASSSASASSSSNRRQYHPYAAPQRRTHASNISSRTAAQRRPTTNTGATTSSSADLSNRNDRLCPNHAGDAAGISQASQPDENGPSDQDTMIDPDAPGDSSYQFKIEPYGSMPAEPEMPRYSMTHIPRGHCVIINNVDFSPCRPRQNLKDRRGSDVDAAQLETLFTSLGYLVTVRHNLSAGEMYNLLESCRTSDHKTYDCFISCILTHGSLGVVYGCDGLSIEIKDLTGLFVGVKCPSLRGKPKVFFLQACQGCELQGLQEGVEFDDPNTRAALIPNETDFLVGYATALGYESLRSKTKGTWYISTLIQALQLYHDKLDIQHLLARVNAHLGKCCTKDGKKQASMHQSLLTKALYL
ncbi:caspase-3-like [Amphiura filiformis]|uniref:caspase-3-like n=1 Tax=Amphiura filiformis TaxID=82378 RepID=UPI003B2234B9